MSKKNLVDTPSMSGSELATLYNNLASEAALLGMPQYKPVTRFATSEVGRKRIESIQVAIQSAGSEGKEITITEVQKKINGDDDAVVPEELRQDTLAKQEAAREAVRETKPEESDMAAAAKKTRKGTTKKAEAAPVSRGFAEDAKIKVLAKENPRRGEAAKRFELYKDGMTVAEYTKKIGSRSEALVHLRWDVNKGHISVK